MILNQLVIVIETKKIRENPDVFVRCNNNDGYELFD